MPVRAFLSTVQTLLALAPCSLIFGHQTLEDAPSDAEEDLVDEAEEQPQASTSAPASGPHHPAGRQHLHQCQQPPLSPSGASLIDNSGCLSISIIVSHTHPPPPPPQLGLIIDNSCCLRPS